MEKRWLQNHRFFMTLQQGTLEKYRKA